VHQAKTSALEPCKARPQDFRTNMEGPIRYQNEQHASSQARSSFKRRNYRSARDRIALCNQGELPLEAVRQAIGLGGKGSGAAKVSESAA
jgi:hypothetical protein